MKITPSTLIIVGALGYVAYRAHKARLFQGMSPEMEGYINKPVRPPVWDRWSWDYLKSIGGVDPVSEQEAAEVKSVADTLNESIGYNGGWSSL